MHACITQELRMRHLQPTNTHHCPAPHLAAPPDGRTFHAKAESMSSPDSKPQACPKINARKCWMSLSLCLGVASVCASA